jgi:hypothetical protein
MNDAPSRFRSPPYPYIGLGRAIERAEKLYAKARNFAVPLSTAAEAWGTKTTSSATPQTTAALLQYGLVQDEGSRNARRIKLTPLGLSIVMDKRPTSPERDAAIKDAAQRPAIFKELWAVYGNASGLDDTALEFALTLGRSQEGRAPFSPDAAKEVIRVFRETMAYSGLSEADSSGDEAPSDASIEKAAANVGDLVQWVSKGELALPEPARVRFVSPDKAWVFIEGSETGIPMDEVEIVSTAPPQKPSTPAPVLPLEQPQAAASSGPDSIKLTIDGGRVLVTAAVDLAGLRKLKKRLDAIELILSEDEE